MIKRAKITEFVGAVFQLLIINLFNTKLLGPVLGSQVFLYVMLFLLHRTLTLLTSLPRVHLQLLRREEWYPPMGVKFFSHQGLVSMGEQQLIAQDTWPFPLVNTWTSRKEEIWCIWFWCILKLKHMSSASIERSVFRNLQSHINKLLCDLHNNVCQFTLILWKCHLLVFYFVFLFPVIFTAPL